MVQSLDKSRRGLSADALKIIAIAAMFVDHAASSFVPDYYGPLGSVLHCIGRITGPTMFFFIAEGYHHTRSKNLYTVRLIIFAAVSYLPFIYLRTGALPTAESFMDLNVIYTLLLAHLALRARHEVPGKAGRWLMIGGLFLLSFWGDWGYLALLYTLLFDYFRGDFPKQAVAYSAVTLVGFLSPLRGLMVSLAAEGWQTWFGPSLGSILVQAGMFLPILLLSFYNGQKGGLGRAGKWVFYIFYPAHLLLLAWLKALLGAG